LSLSFALIASNPFAAAVLPVHGSSQPFRALRSGDVERLAPDQETRILEDTGILQRQAIPQYQQWKTTNPNGLVPKASEFHSLDAFALLL
jgi:hypothetical protein